MDAAFVLVVPKAPGVLPAPDAPRPTALELGFVAHERLDWSSPSGAVHLSAWRSAAGEPWQCGPSGVTIIAGDLRRADRSWGEGLGAATALAAEAATRQVPALLPDLRGVYAAVALDQHGDGWAFADPVGHRCLYHGENDEVVVVSSRASLAAQALTRPGAPVARDPVGVCWLAFTTYRVGTGSGFEQIRVARPGERLRLAAGRPSWEGGDPFVVAPDHEYRSTPIPDLAAWVLDDIGDALRQLLAVSADRHVLMLTGGKDSRLVLAAAIHVGIADDLEYETIGPPGLVDVEIAASLAARYGLRHEVRFVGLRPDQPLAERTRTFVATTGGMVSGWDLESASEPGVLRITGLCGELLRSCTRVPDPIVTAARYERLFAPNRVGRLGLLRPDVDKEFRTTLIRRLSELPTPDADPLDRVQRHYATTRMRYTRLGAREEITGGARRHPLSSPLGLTAALALDPRDRQSELLVGSILSIASPELVTHPFADGGWDPRARAHLDLPEPVKSAKSAPAGRKATTLMTSITAKGADERTDYLAEVFHDASESPAWSRLDGAAVLGGLERWDELTPGERQELFGAATVIEWLSGR